MEEQSRDETSSWYWLEQFFDRYPDGGLKEFDEWVKTAPSLLGSAKLLGATRETLAQGLEAERLLGLDGEATVEEASLFGPREGAVAARSSPPGSSLQVGRRIGSFVLERFIAKGGMGQVWEAEDTSLQRRVALKLVLPDRIDEHHLALFAREAKAGGRLYHANIVTTLGHGTDEGLAWIAQELVEGSWTLKDSIAALAREDSLPRDYFRRVAELVASIADGIQAAHDAGVVHRDIKPQNILIAGQEQPKVTDFGLARVNDDSFMSRTGDLAGTWAYMSPEQVSAKRMGLDHRTDIFSLGVVMYEMLTLRRPFGGDTSQATVAMILTEEPPSPSRVRSQCPAELSIICGRAMEKAPGRRYQTMADLAADLRRHLANEPIEARPSGPLARGVKWSRRHPAVSSAGAIGLLALGAVSLLSVDLAQKTRSAMSNELLAQSRARELATANQQLEQTAANLLEQTELAEERARTNAELARVAEARADEVLSLSASKDLEDLISRASTLWPAHPDLLPELEQWLEDAQVLLTGSPGDADSGAKARPSIRDHERKLAELLARSIPQDDEQQLALAREHASYPELELARAELGWRRRMLGEEEWPDASEVEVQMDGEDLPSDGAQLLAMARELSGAGAKNLDGVTRGWVLAGRALAADPPADRPEFFADALLTLAWAEARLGRGEEARAALDEALAEGEALEDASSLAQLEEDIARLESFLLQWEGAELSEREAELPGLETRIAALEVEVGERVMEDPEDAWWQRQLSILLEGIWQLHDPETGLAGNTLAEPFGWGVARRVEFARNLELLDDDEELAQRWWDATVAIAGSEHYDGLKLRPQRGLVPIGPDPGSGLWEFAHVASGEEARRDADGKLILEEETGLVLVLVPGGTFLMGAQSSDPEGDNYDPAAEEKEGPVHPVMLSPYFLSKYQMTMAQWERVTSVNPSFYQTPSLVPTRMHPVEQVDWNECVEVLARLELELPSEAQWERACRAGTSSPWSFGAERESLRGKINIADKTAAEGSAKWPTIADWPDNEDGAVLHWQVGAYPANDFGLHEMHGNVWEWCKDGYDSKVYSAERGPDPLVPAAKYPSRVARGGSFTGTVRLARSSFRIGYAPEGRLSNLGVRPARAVDAEVTDASRQ